MTISRSSECSGEDPSSSGVWISVTQCRAVSEEYLKCKQRLCNLFLVPSCCVVEGMMQYTLAINSELIVKSTFKGEDTSTYDGPK